MVKADFVRDAAGRMTTTKREPVEITATRTPLRNNDLAVNGTQEKGKGLGNY